MWRRRHAGPYVIWLRHGTILGQDVTLLQSFIKLVHISFLDSVMHDMCMFIVNSYTRMSDWIWCICYWNTVC